MPPKGRPKCITVKPSQTRTQVFNPKTGRFVFQRVTEVSRKRTLEVEDIEPGPVSTSTNDIGHSPASDEHLSKYAQKKRTRLDRWENFSGDFLTVRTEANVPSQYHCDLCDNKGRIENIIRCNDCGSNAFFCKTHYHEYHRLSPFHCPEIWEGGVFLPFQPQDLPLLQRPNHHCQTGRFKDICAVNCNGMCCQVKVRFCDCEAEPVTLLRHNLWPASPQNPTVAFHLALMDWLRALILECQVSVKGFVDAISAKMNTFRQLNSNQVTQLYRGLVTDACNHYMHHYNQLLHLDHIDPLLDDGTSCPACFEAEKPIFSFDGNFGLVRKASSGKSIATTHYQGRYFLNQDSVDEFVKESEGKQHPRKGGECSNFQAGNPLRSKPKVAKLDETGVFGAACRHEFPKQFMSLKHGERLSYPVHLLKTIRDENAGRKIVIMYDIACTLSGHLKKVNEDIGNITLVLPIFHCFGHKMTCQLDYGPRRTAGIGLTDGETLERLWSYLRKFCTITKQMTPERRLDLLTEALLHYARKLRKNLSSYLLQKQKKASATSTTTQTELSRCSPGLSEARVQQMRQAEKEACQLRQSTMEKHASLDTYALVLFEFYNQSTSANSNNDKLQRLQGKLLQLEETKHMQRWEADSEIYRKTLLTAVDGKRLQLVEKMRSLSAERQFHLSKMTECRGQQTWKKLDKNVRGVNKRLEKTLEEYNMYSEVPALPTSKLQQNLSLQQVADQRGGVLAFSEPSSNILSLYDTFHRSREELLLLSAECLSAHTWYAIKHAAALRLFEAAGDPVETSLYEKGYRALLQQHMFQYEIAMRELEEISKNVCIPGTHTVDIHPKPVLQRLSEETVMQCQPALDLILGEISEEEKEELLDMLEESDSESESDD